MKLTREAIDVFVPEHGRTSCSDNNTCNRFEKVVIKKDRTGKQYISDDTYAPRCTRCYLLDHIGDELSELPWELKVYLELNTKIVED